MSAAWLPASARAAVDQVVGRGNSSSSAAYQLVDSSPSRVGTHQFTPAAHFADSSNDDLATPDSSTVAWSRTRSTRKSIIVFFSICAVAAVVFLRYSHNRLPPPATPTSPSRDLSIVGEGCDLAPLLEERNDPRFWSVEVDQSVRHVVVRPKEHELYYNCPVLADAWFTVRLLFANDEIRLLDNPRQLSHGEYEFDLVAPLGGQKSGQVQIEAVLELSWFPGGVDGMPCPAEACNYTTLIDQGMDWVGKAVLSDAGTLPTYENAIAPLPAVLDTTPYCPSVDNLPGYWNNATRAYTPLDSDGQPCRLRTVTDFKRRGHRRWIRFLGDSNMRFFFLWNYPKMVGAPTCLATTRKFRYMCWNDEALFTWDWWYFRQRDESTTEDEPYSEVEMEELLNLRLPDMMDKSKTKLPWAESPDWPSHFDDFDEPAERIYVSLGSHSSYATALGVSETMRKMIPTFERFPALRLVLTSATAPARIPVKYIKDRVMRHNIMIDQTNRVIADYARKAKIGVVDIFTMTRTGGTAWMIDNVHFHSRMYKDWARVFFTEWNGGEVSEE